MKVTLFPDKKSEGLEKWAIKFTVIMGVAVFLSFFTTITTPLVGFFALAYLVSPV